MIKLFLFNFLIVLILIGCNNPVNNKDELYDIEYKATLVFSATYIYFPLTYDTSFSIHGIIKSLADDRKIDGGKMTICDYEFEFDTSYAYKSYPYGYFRLRLKDIKEEPKFRLKTLWGVSGNEYYNISEYYNTIRMPERIEIKEPMLDEDVSRKNGIELKWEQELKNKGEIRCSVSDYLLRPIFDGYTEDDGELFIDIDDVVPKTYVMVELRRYHTVIDTFENVIYKFLIESSDVKKFYIVE